MLRYFIVLVYIGLGLVSAVILFACIWWLLASPSHDRNWREDYAMLPSVSWMETSTATVHNVRDWLFTDGTYPESQPYVSKTIRLDSLKQAYFMVEPFSSWDAVGHTFFTFEFEDGSAIVASIEARREKGEEYSVVKGLLPYFEYMYVWTTERDMYTNTTYFANDSLYRYPLTISLQSQKYLLQRLLERTDELSKRPQFYNLITANCTSLLAREANAIQKGSVPFHYSWVLTGYADSYLHRLGIISNEKSFESTEQAALITPAIKRVLEKQPGVEEREFSRYLRSEILLDQHTSR